MTNVSRKFRAAKIAAVFAAALAMGACAKNPSRRGRRIAGQCQCRHARQPAGFVVNVGDRVFFNSNSSELTPQSVATLDKQAQWLRSYAQYSFTVEGHADERGTREYNIALGARRGAGGARLSGLARHPGASYAHDFLRQGAAGRGLRRHFLLVAESPFGDGAQRQLLKFEEIKWGKGTTGASRRRLCFVASAFGTMSCDIFRSFPVFG